MRLKSGQFWVKITGFSTKWPLFWMFVILFTFMHQILVELYWRIVSIFLSVNLDDAGF
jgi:hypothetical protein